MKYKVQVPSTQGWADLKGTIDDGESYEVELFDTREEAQASIDSIQADIPDFEGRVVTEDTEAESDLY